ncbi:MAG: MFS transporter [Oscillospiraceae bacterium]|nr:MFS transporter [Oscillospiraceae bacterium]
MQEKTKLGGLNWTALIVFGLFGQIAWTIENMYLNVFLYKTVTYDPDAVAIMVAASAVTATLTALLMGGLSDKLGKRKPLISWGYIIWGFTILVFAFISKENTARMFPAADAVVLTVALVVIMDCVMTFFGATANDAAFNAWVTDITVPKTRGRAEGVLSALPLAALLIVFGGLDGITQTGNWTLFFVIIGVLVTAGGVSGLFIIKDNPAEKPPKSDLLYGFRPSVIKENKQLYRLFLLMGIYCTAQQVFFPYLMIYIEYHLGIKDYAILLGVILILGAAASVISGNLVDRYGKRPFVLISGCIFTVGLLLMYFHGAYIKDTPLNIPILLPFAIIMFSGSLMLSLVINAAIRDHLPEAQRGHFNGIRMIFFVLIPMVAGPFIGSAIIKSGQTFLDEFGAQQLIPGAEIFLGAAVIAAFMFIPMRRVISEMRQEK